MMRARWGRWHGYMDEVEEAMRVAGQHLGEVEALLAEVYERSTWKGGKRDSADSEIVRRALDIPFFRGLLETAHRLDSLSEIENKGFVGRRWREGETAAEQMSQSRNPNPKASRDEEVEEEEKIAFADEEAPARIVAAERALQDRSRSLVVVLDNLVNSRNVSAILRSVEAMGLQEVHIVQAEGKPALERTLTTRSERWLDIYWHRTGREVIGKLRGRGYRILAADFGEGAVEVEAIELSGPTALVFGSEQLGVSEALRQEADGLFYLPNSGFTAYVNVSVAAAISVYALDRRMRESGLREPLSGDEVSVLRPAWYSMLAKGDDVKRAQYRAWAERPPVLDPVASDQNPRR
jgi:tRNA (guanosine-2'-O-)-methyltransferase